MKSSKKITDLAYLEESSAGSKEFLKEMIEIFLRQTPEFLKELQGQAEDLSSFRKVMHKFKPSIKTMGMVKGQELIREIESLYKDGNEYSPERVAPLLEALNNECNLAFAELNEYLNALR